MSYEKCLQWQELFNLAVLENVGEEKLVEIGYRVAGWPFSSLNFELKYNFSTEDLVSKKRHSDAGRVLLDYSKDIREAVIAFVQGNLFSEARRIVRVFASRPTCNANNSSYFRRQVFHPKLSSWRT